MATQDMANKILQGKDGNVWVNGSLLANLSKIEAKIKADSEDVNFCGDQSTYTVFNGYSGEGTITCKKVDSVLFKTIADAFSSGTMPTIKIITALTSKSTNTTERVSLEGVLFTELSLASFEAKKMLEEEFPFKFSKFTVLETL